MKKTFLALFLGVSMFYYSCETRPGATDDSVSRAEEINEETLADVDEDLARDAESLVDLSSATMMQWQISEDAAERATEQSVQRFAKKAASDYKELQEELQDLASDKNITLPLDISHNHRNSLHDLREADEDDFDVEYLDEIASTSNNYASELESLIENTNDEDIRSWASKALNTYREHENQAEKLLKKKGEDRGGLFGIFNRNNDKEKDNNQNMEDYEPDSFEGQDE